MVKILVGACDLTGYPRPIAQATSTMVYLRLHNVRVPQQYAASYKARIVTCLYRFLYGKGLGRKLDEAVGRSDHSRFQRYELPLELKADTLSKGEWVWAPSCQAVAAEMFSHASAHLGWAQPILPSVASGTPRRPV